MVIAINFEQTWFKFCDLKYLIVITTGSLANMYRSLQKLEHCSGDDAGKITKLKIKGFGIDPNGRKIVTVIVSTFTGHLGNLAADQANKIFLLDNIDASTAYVRVSFSNEDLEGMNLYFLIK